MASGIKVASTVPAALGVPPPLGAEVNRTGGPGRGDARLGMTVEGHARELVHHMDRIMRRLVFSQELLTAEEPLSRQEIGVVDTLGAEGPMTMGELARRLRLPLSTGTRVVDGLAARDVIRRERPEENRRVVRVALTAKGRALYQAALAARVAAFRVTLQTLRLDERRELIRLFRKIAAVVGSQPA